MDPKFFTLLAAGPISHLWDPFDMLPIIFVTQALQPPPVHMALAHQRIMASLHGPPTSHRLANMSSRWLPTSSAPPP